MSLLSLLVTFCAIASLSFGHPQPRDQVSANGTKLVYENGQEVATREMSSNKSRVSTSSFFFSNATIEDDLRMIDLAIKSAKKEIARSKQLREEAEKLLLKLKQMNITKI